MIDAWTLMDPARRRQDPGELAVRICPNPECGHQLLPVQEDCPECGRVWTADSIARERPWEQPAFVVSMGIIGTVMVLPIVGAVLIGVAGMIRTAMGGG